MGRPKKIKEPSEIETSSEKPRHKKYTPSKKTPIIKLVNQLAINPKLTQRQLAQINNVKQQSISAMFQRYGIDQKFIESFKENRADILAGIQDTVLSTLSVEDIKASSVRDRAVTFGVLYDKERLERGQSTQNIATIMASSVIEATGVRTTSSDAIDGEIIK